MVFCPLSATLFITTRLPPRALSSEPVASDSIHVWASVLGVRLSAALTLISRMPRAAAMPIFM